MQEVKVRPLEKGDRVAIVAPASPVDEKLLERGKTVLEAQGLLVEWTETILTKEGYLAGSDARRAEELNYFLKRDDIRAIFVARGGYGTLRILNQIDFSALTDHPRPIIGFSDTTALISYVSTKLEIPAIHACMPATEAALREDICHTNLLVQILRDEIAYPFVTYENLRSRGHGDPVRGKIFGGNLSVLCSLMGTPFEPDFAGRILFLEEVDEKAYRVDRKMTQLRLSGNLGKLSAVLMGRFVPVVGGNPALLEDIVAGECEAAGVPLFCGFPGGHEGENIPVPFGVTGEIQTEKGRGMLTLLESPFSG
jgi:muramoyltetrapeptide carboxypeptidase